MPDELGYDELVQEDMGGYRRTADYHLKAEFRLGQNVLD